MYRPANAVPYAAVEAELQGVYLKYCTMDPKGTLIMGAASELEQKSCAFQHWIHQWTHGNLLVTQLEGRGRTHTALWLTQPTRNTLLNCDFYLVYLFCRCWNKDDKCQGRDQVKRVCIHTHTAWHFMLGLYLTTSNYYKRVLVLDTKAWLSAAPLKYSSGSWHTTSATTTVDFLAWNHWRRWKVFRHPQGWKAPGAHCSTASWAPVAHRCSGKDKAPKRLERLIPVRR